MDLITKSKLNQILKNSSQLKITTNQLQEVSGKPYKIEISGVYCILEAAERKENQKVNQVLKPFKI